MILAWEPVAVSLRVCGWEFAERRGRDEWLRIALTVGTWRVVDPALQFSEARELGEWLANPVDEISFLEPNLRFYVSDGVVILALAAECRPPAPWPAVLRLAVPPDASREWLDSLPDC